MRNAPLVLASMSGDLDNAKLLLARGAKPSESALSEAVTFGYPDIARTLIMAGADAGIIAGSGINLLHWAAITDRPQLVPVLVDARVPVNTMDDNGYTRCAVDRSQPNQPNTVYIDDLLRAPGRDSCCRATRDRIGFGAKRDINCGTR